MLKFVAQLVAIAVIGGVCGFFQLSWWLTVPAVLAGFVFTHLAWERLFPNPFVYLGAMPIATDDPLLLEAVERAKETWPDFLAIYPEHRRDSVVKFRLQTESGEIENVWGDLLEIDSSTATVYLRTPPVGDVVLEDRRMTIPVEDIVDWQVEFPDGSLRGGFTMQATYKIFAREQGHMPREFLEQLQRYLPLLEGESSSAV